VTALHVLSSRETDAMAVQHTPSPCLSPAVQKADDSDQKDNQPPNTTVNNQADDHQKAGPSRRVITPVASSHQQMASGLLRLPPFWETILISGSHKWKLDFTFTKSTQMMIDSTQYLQPWRNQESLSNYPNAYGIHQHKICISL
jgi:hypothetical protein